MESYALVSFIAYYYRPPPVTHHPPPAAHHAPPATHPLPAT